MKAGIESPHHGEDKRDRRLAGFNESSMHDAEMEEMLVEYMGRRFLDNIIALFKQDSTVYLFIADMLGSDNIRVRLGATALVGISLYSVDERFGSFSVFSFTDLTRAVI